MGAARIAAVVAAVLVLPLGSGVAQADPPPAPVFSEGQAQPVFDPADVVREDVWVTAPVDSDHDGQSDLVHAQVVRPKATDAGMKVPVVYEASPYFAGGNDVANHNVDTELYVPGEARTAAVGVGPHAPPPIRWSYQDYFTARGFAVVYGESLGTGLSTGCPTTGDVNETIGARSVIDWLGGRAPARDEAGTPVTASWSTGHTGMMGVSYNGTLPNAVATTGVEGLETIVPIAAISNWYEYYRNDGAVVAAGGFQGEDTDVLAEYVYTRADRAICRPVIDGLTAAQDRVTGDYSPFWDVRNYRNDVGKVHASVLAVHGLNDWNVKTDQVAAWYEALKAHGVEHKIWLHQSGHADPISLRRDVWLVTLNKWLSHYLYGVDNGIEREPKATIQREDKSWVDEADWPAPGTRDVKVHPWPGGRAKGGLDAHPVPGRADVESLADDASKTVQQLADAATSGNRLLYATPAVKQPVRLSGTARADLQLAFDRPAANVTVALLDRSPDGTSFVISRGWTDPQNRRSPSVTTPIRPGISYRIAVSLMPKDYVLPAGHHLEFLVASSDHDYTLRPRPGAGLSLDLTRTSLILPVTGGKPALGF
ncbi:Xaa-Pro dipeptidyl-peptidase [Amycolatopsis sp. FDAARGOS 1241]|uniref:Xaa-Pro dipeptidyl-peptidase n=1 Tax=Amycolatopsis sp. FDAARGOS 1241 TaxID=2778070 RepID=UPI00194FACD0|nr:Xaa-Pro dipeptidyl-peptidase [Amycolatopsis sp. FDAARGOS 1241]QRP44079.1 Xaa-Pro dipeptidyl-peptidase [Amycolatopsis sp. FDAARGOS 1241]